MMDFVDIARGRGIEDDLFLLYLQKKVGIGEKEQYSAADVYVTLLGRHKRTYQAWEKEPSFPVPAPEKRWHRRAYSPEQVVQILWWWWNHRALESRGRDKDAIGKT